MSDDIGGGVGNVWLSTHGPLVDSHNLLHHWFLNLLHRLHDVLHMLHFLHNFMWNLHMLHDFTHNDLLHWVGLLNVHDLLNWHRHMLDLLHWHLTGHRHLDDLFHNAFHWDRYVTVADLLNRHLDLIRLRHSDLIGLGNLAVHISHNFLDHGVRDWSVHDLLNFIRDTNLFSHLNDVWNFNTSLNDFLNRVGLRNFHHLVNGVRFRTVNNFLHWVGYLNLLTDLDLNRAVHTSFHDLLHRVRHRPVNHLLDSVGHTLLNDPLHRVGNLPVNNLLHGVWNLHVLDHLLVHWDGHLDHSLTDLFNRYWDVLGPHNFVWAGHIDGAHDFMRDWDFDADWDWNLTMDLHDFFVGAVDGNLNHSFTDLLHRDRYTAFNDLLHWVRDLNGFHDGDIIWLLHSALNNLLDGVGHSCLHDFLHCMWHWHVNPFIHRIWHLHMARVRHLHIIWFGAVHSADDLMGSGDIDSSHIFDVLHHINVLGLLRALGDGDTCSLHLGRASWGAARTIRHRHG